MKYCLSSRQPERFLKKADQIKIEMRDFRAIPDFVENYPNRDLILELEEELPAEFSWTAIEAYAKKTNNKFYLAVSNLRQAVECNKRGINFYYKYMITSFYELDTLKSLGASYILIGIPLIFDLNNVKKYGIPVRAIPNIAYEPYLVRNDGICGQWIRPEDTEFYNSYIDVFEFYSNGDLDKEMTLYHIYAENQNWPGNLNLLIENLGIDFNNKLLYDENFAEKRSNCKQKCMSQHSCHYCPALLKFASTFKGCSNNSKDNI